MMYTSGLVVTGPPADFSPARIVNCAKPLKGLARLMVSESALELRLTFLIPTPLPVTCLPFFFTSVANW